jgi:glycine oxidase
MRPDVIVVGGGVIGCAVSYELARAGATPLLLERDALGAHASSAAAGMLAPIAESGGRGPVYEIGTRALADYASWLEEIVELSGVDPGWAPCGVLRLARAGDVAELQDCAIRLAEQGCAWLGPDELHKREPGVSPSFEGALWSPREACVDPALLTRGLALAARRRGAQLRENASVIELLRKGDRVRGVRTPEAEWLAPEVVLCTGAWLPPSTDRDWPVMPVKGQMLALEAASAPRSILWSDATYLVPRPDGSLRVGATVEHAGFDARPTAAGVTRLLGAAQALLPDLRDARFLRAWAGLRPGTPDHLPLLGPVPHTRGLWVAAGHYRNGILLAPWTGRAMRDLILHTKPTPGLEACAPDRFAAA